jgi:urea carboxylase
MEGPGGYQFIGRTCQMWNRYRQTTAFTHGRPWLLRFFDQIRFYPVTNAELTKFREDFPHDKARLKIEETTFRLGDYQKFLAENAGTITVFKTRQQAAFEAERRRWEESGQLNVSIEAASAVTVDEQAIPAGCTAVLAHVPGNIWKISVSAGAVVKDGDTLVILESMKMEVSVVANHPGKVREVRCVAGRPVNAGETLIVLES